MGESVSPKMRKQITVVQEQLGKYVKKPQLLDKNLVRPPFRFLHDIFISLTSSSGFFKGLYTAGEIDMTGLNTRDEKTLFLQKSFDVLEKVTGKSLDIKVAKVLAGQEADKTNSALLAIAEALDTGLSSREAVMAFTGVDPDVKVSKKEVPKKTAPKGKPAAANKPAEKTKPPAAGKANPYESRQSQGQSKVKPTTKSQPALTKAKPEEVPRVAGSRRGSTTAEPAAELGRRGSITKLVTRTPSSQNVKNPEPKQPKAEPAKEEGSKDTSSRRGSVEQVEVPRRGSVTKLTRTPSNQSLTSAEPPRPAQPSISAETLKPDPEFMGEVESLLQEHGIEVEPAPVVVKPEPEVVPPAAPAPAPAPHPKPASRQPTAASRSTSGLVKAKPGTRAPTAGQVKASHEVIVPVPAEPEPPVPVQPPATTESTLTRPLTSRMRGRPGSANRPTSARPAPPRPITARQEAVEPFRPPTSTVPLILENENLDEDDEYMIAQEKATQGLFETLGENLISRPTINGEEANPFPATDAKGSLVHQILETQKDLEANEESESGVDDMDRAQSAMKAEMDKIKALIQNTARASNPIGKLMDYVQDDIETMVSEFKRYKAETKILDDALAQEKEVTRKIMLPYQRKIRELDDRIEEQRWLGISAYMDIQHLDERFENVGRALDEVDEEVVRELPTQFLLDEEEVDMTEADLEVEVAEKQDSKPRLLYGSRPWNLRIRPKAPRKNLKNIKHLFAIGNTADEFYSSEEEREAEPLKPRVKNKLKKQGSGSLLVNPTFLAPPGAELDSLEIMERSRERGDEGDSAAGKALDGDGGN